ncbi:MAG TPA: hypothetical protein VGR42_02710 [Casimicrobiaceae bacterium]|nr:hypothetical protein [Casimicrobiaceae bacterium]
MYAPAKHWTHDAIGASTGIAGLGLLVAIVAAGGPIGLGIGAVIGGGFMFGVLACGLKETAARRSNKRRAEAREALAASYVPVPPIVAIPLFIDATASELDAAAAGQSGFAPVTSLTEVQVLRQRAGREREARHAILRGA